MLNIELASQPEKFLKKAEKNLAKRIFRRIEKLAEIPFPKNVKRVLNRREKVFRVRIGYYRIEYVVLYDRNLIFITQIEKRPRAYS